MTPENAWIYGVLPFVTMAILTAGFVFVFRQRSAARRAALGGQQIPPRPDAQARPWWGNPLVWLAIGLVSVLLGVFVWPGLFGFTFIFIPIRWWRTPKTPRLDPRSNGHTHRDAGSFMPE
jgi:polyferredoxin